MVGISNGNITIGYMEGTGKERPKMIVRNEQTGDIETFGAFTNIEAADAWLKNLKELMYFGT